MALFEIARDGLVPFRQLFGSQLFENEIEQLLWDNLDDLLGERLFRIRRQPKLVDGGIPDILAIDTSGAPVVIEVKRDIDRRQIAQTLEYAGWARVASLETMASLYHRGRELFWQDWQTFADSATPKPLNRTPRLVLVARDLDPRTRSSFEYLQEFHVPITMVGVGLYEDSTGRRFLDVEGIDEPELNLEPAVATPTETGSFPNLEFTDGPIPTITRRRIPRVAIADLIGMGLLSVGDQLTWHQPRIGVTHRATVTADGRLELPDGSHHSSVSSAATAAAGATAIDGWTAWRVETRGGVPIDDLRSQFLASIDADAGETSSNDAQ